MRSNARTCHQLESDGSVVTGILDHGIGHPDGFTSRLSPVGEYSCDEVRQGKPLARRDEGADGPDGGQGSARDATHGLMVESGDPLPGFEGRHSESSVPATEAVARIRRRSSSNEKSSQ